MDLTKMKKSKMLKETFGKEYDDVVELVENLFKKYKDECKDVRKMKHLPSSVISEIATKSGIITKKMIGIDDFELDEEYAKDDYNHLLLGNLCYRHQCAKIRGASIKSRRNYCEI